MKKEELQAKLEELGKEYDKRWGVKRLEEELAKLEEPEEAVEKTLEAIEKAVSKPKEEEKVEEVEEERPEVLHTKEGAVMKATVKHNGVTYLAGEVVTLEPEVKKEFEEKGLV